MSVARLIRFFFGVVIAAILLAILLPIFGVPSSHFLPPGHVWTNAQGAIAGVAEDKFYSETNNVFNVGGHLLFVDYEFYAKAPPAVRGGGPGPKTIYHGQVKVAKEEYDAVKLPRGSSQINTAKGGEKIAILPNQYVRVKYEITDPNINGVAAFNDNGTWVPWGERSVSGPSNTFSGWLVWVVVTLGLGYVFMLLLERFSSRENI